uniref:Fibroblast growth factor 17-like protein n=1 Tax=Cladonema pacificum TaxID=499903 RepID=A0A8D6HA71_9CNID|nr:fibroblast growth factor 17-like protein [Cladonema pacificum]
MLMITYSHVKVYWLFLLLNAYSTENSYLNHRNLRSTPNSAPDKNILNMLSTDSPRELLRRLKNNIRQIERDGRTTPPTKIKGRYVRDENINLYSIMATPTNVRRVYIKSKSGMYLQINNQGVLCGGRKINKNVVFIIESMSRGVVRLRGEKSGKYICINRNKRIVLKSKAVAKCLLQQYMEENNYVLFWSKMFSKSIDGENGWFLALRHNGKIKIPEKTRLGERSTMFHVHHVYDTT